MEDVKSKKKLCDCKQEEEEENVQPTICFFDK